MKSLLREPLIHFLCIGAALFLLFEVFDNPADPQSRRVVITNGQIEYLKASYARSRQRLPTGQELQELVDGYVREEIFYREALSLGLDKNDPVIRRRLQQKLELMGDDLVGIIVPSDEDLQRFLEIYADNFKVEPKIAFRHVYFNVTQRGNSVEEEATKLLALLSDDEIKSDPDSLGDSLILPNSFKLSPVSEIANMFGKPFSLELVNNTHGQWVGPVLSGYGLHLIMVTDYVAGRLPLLDEIRESVEWDWSAAHKAELKANIYKELRKKYTVDFEQPEIGAKSFEAISIAQAAQEDQQ